MPDLSGLTGLLGPMLSNLNQSGDGSVPDLAGMLGPMMSSLGQPPSQLTIIDEESET